MPAVTASEVRLYQRQLANL